MTPIRVPEPHRYTFKAVSAMDAPSYEQLRVAIESAGDGYVGVSRLISAARESGVALTDDDGDAIDPSSVILALLSVPPGRAVHGVPLHEFAEAIADDVVDVPLREGLRNRIVELVSIPCVSLTAKADDVASEHHRTFHSARVLTELRPIFTDDVDGGVLGTVMSHLLRIDCFTNGRVEDHYFSLDDSNLFELKSAIDRAIGKRDALTGYLNGIGLARLETDRS